MCFLLLLFLVCFDLDFGGGGLLSLVLRIFLVESLGYLGTAGTETSVPYVYLIRYPRPMQVQNTI